MMTKTITFLTKTYALSLVAGMAEPRPTIVEHMSGPELCSLYNIVASNLDRKPVRKFSDHSTAVKRTWAILADFEAVVEAEADGRLPPVDPSNKAGEGKDALTIGLPPKDTAARKKRGMRFVFPAEDTIKPIRADSARGKALAVLQRDGGGTFADVQKATGWNERQAYEGIRLLHYYSGWGLAEAEVDGVTRIRVFSDNRTKR